jgi:hypothetical protein
MTVASLFDYDAEGQDLLKPDLESTMTLSHTALERKDFSIYRILMRATFALAKT